MWDLPQTPDVLGALGSIFTGVAALWGAYTAHRGLRTWKTQSLWADEVSLAKRLIISLENRMSAFRRLRSASMRAAEMQSAHPHDQFNEPEREVAFNKALEFRMNSLWELREGMQPLVEEAALYWGEEIKEKEESLLALENSVFRAHEDLPMFERAVEHSNSEENRQAVMERRRIVWDSSTPDDVGNQYSEVARELEEVLRRKLEHHFK